MNYDIGVPKEIARVIELTRKGELIMQAEEDAKELIVHRLREDARRIVEIEKKVVTFKKEQAEHPDDIIRPRR